MQDRKSVRYASDDMMMSAFSVSAMFPGSLLTVLLWLPGTVLLLFVLMILPGLLRPSVHAGELIKAAYAYLAESVGALLMTIGGLPAVYAVLAQQTLPSAIYVGLLLLFVIGGIVYLAHDSLLQHIDNTSKEVPGMLFMYVWKFIGLITVVFSCLTFLLSLLLQNNQPSGFWVTPVVLLLYGLLLLWFTLTPQAKQKTHTARAHGKKAVK